MTAGTGAFGFSGVPAGLLAHRRLTAAAAAFPFTGVPAGLYAHRRVSVEAGAFPFLGVDVTFDHVVPLDFTTVNWWAAVVQEVNAHVYVSEVIAATAVQQRNEAYVLEELNEEVVVK